MIQFEQLRAAAKAEKEQAGSAVAPALLIGFITGALVGVALILREGAAARKRAVPFGPFLALGGFVCLLAGDQIVDWYLNTFLNG